MGGYKETDSKSFFLLTDNSIAAKLSSCMLGHASIESSLWLLPLSFGVLYIIFLMHRGTVYVVRRMQEVSRAPTLLCLLEWP